MTVGYLRDVRYFVTGVTGFLGGYVVADLLGAGHEVTALVSSRELATEVAAHGVNPHLGSVLDISSLRRGMATADGVIHTAGHRLRPGNRAMVESMVIDGTRNVLTAARGSGVPRVVCTSTLGIFSDTGGALVDESYRYTDKHLTEHDRIRAASYYEDILPLMKAGAPVMVVLTGAVYGPGDTSRMASVLSRFLRGRARVVPRSTAYCWAHVEDTARAHTLAMAWGEPGDTYIAGGEPHTVRDVLTRAATIVGRSRPPMAFPDWLATAPAAVIGGVSTVVPPLRPFAERLRLARGVTYLGSDAKARRQLGWDPRSLDDGLPEAIESLLRRLLEPA